MDGRSKMRAALRRERGFAALLAICVLMAAAAALHASRLHASETVVVADFKPPISALVDINSADRELLMTLPGVGEKMAGRIIAGRPYSCAADLLAVNGIGEKTLAALMERICIDGVPPSEAEAS